MEHTIWTQQQPMPEFPNLHGNRKTEVLIVGGGLAGLLCAWRMEKAGIDYLLIEANRICSGTSGRTTAKITSQHGLIYHKLLQKHGKTVARKYWEANEAAIREYEKLAGIVDCDFQKTDNFIYSRDDRQALREEITALGRLGIPARFVKNLPLPFPVKGAVCFGNQAQFHPMKFAAGIARKLRIYEGTTAREFEGTCVKTDCGSITASKIIIATHFPIINKPIYRLCKEVIIQYFAHN